jgi:hypothetical protein
VDTLRLFLQLDETAVQVQIKKCKPFWQEYCRIMLYDVGYYEGTLD